MNHIYRRCSPERRKAIDAAAAEATAQEMADARHALDCITRTGRYFDYEAMTERSLRIVHLFVAPANEAKGIPR